MLTNKDHFYICHYFKFLTNLISNSLQHSNCWPEIPSLGVDFGLELNSISYVSWMLAVTVSLFPLFLSRASLYFIALLQILAKSLETSL